MPAQYPGIGWPADSQVDLLRKLVNNTALIAEGGISGGGVTQIVAGANVTISPLNGLGAVTINATGGGGGGGGNDYAASTDIGAGTTVSPTQPTYTYQLTYVGAAGARNLILNTSGRTAGDKVFLDLIFPATSGIVISVRNATAGGTLLLPVESFPAQTFTTDGNILSAHWEFTYSGSAWVYDMSNIPA